MSMDPTPPWFNEAEVARARRQLADRFKGAVDQEPERGVVGPAWCYAVDQDVGVDERPVSWARHGHLCGRSDCAGSSPRALATQVAPASDRSRHLDQ